MDLVLYCNCFPNHEARSQQANQKNLMCHARSLDQFYRKDLTQKGYYFDDQGHNISDDNIWLGDLTGLYWVWKNTDDQWVGTNQYRRFYSDQYLSTLCASEKTLWISDYVEFSCSLSQQYIRCHGTIGLHILWEAAKQKSIPFTTDMVESLDWTYKISPCNMFFAHRSLFDKLCEILFSTIFEIKDGVRYSLPYVQIDNQGQYQTRMLAFLAERILNIIYNNHRHFLGNVQILPVPYDTYGKK